MKTTKAWSESPMRQWRGDSPHLWDLRSACIGNALDLLKDARILFSNRRYARAFALAFTAYEEFGKAQIVSDFITGVCSRTEFDEAFRRHDLKSSYNKRKIAINSDRSKPPTVEYDTKDNESLFKMRMNSLYVDCGDEYKPLTPKARITSPIARQAIQQVNDYISRILQMEAFAERIGTEALAK